MKAAPLELISPVSESSSIITSSPLLLEDEYFGGNESKVLWGETTISFFLGCRLAWWTWDFSVVTAFCSGGRSWVWRNKMRNVSAPDMSPMSGACANLLVSIRMLLFLAVVECQSRLKEETYHV